MAQLTIQKREEMKGLINQGLPIRQIGKIIGCSIGTVQHWKRKLNRDQVPSKYSKVTTDEAAAMKAMHEAGASWCDIGKAFGRDRNVVRCHVDAAYEARQRNAVDQWKASEHGKAHLAAYQQSPERKSAQRENQKKHQHSPLAVARHKRAEHKRTHGPKAAEYRAWRRDYHAKRRGEPEFRAMANLQSLFAMQSKAYKMNKKGSMPEVFGISIPDFLATQNPELVELWLTTDNEVHWDHIRPVNSFPDKMDSAQMALCWNYKNFQLLTKSDNTSKSDKFTAEDAEAWAHLMRSKGYKGDLFLIDGEQHAAA